MTKTDRFKDLSDFHAEKLRLDAIRDVHADRLESHFNALKEGKFRSTLLKNSVNEALGSFAPGKILGSILGGGGLGSAISMATGTAKGGLMKRAGLFALGLAAPKLLKKVESISLPDIGQELGVSWRRLKEHMQERREERHLRKVKEELEDQSENVQL
ncbi:MAG: hypothetical protein IPN44_10475 [Flavobacteriales bacterium]|nr:hypothetical protein [Flavobacteriales bacterium]